MPKENQTIYACSNCGAQYPKWQGRCNECGAWGSLNETASKPKTGVKFDVGEIIDLGRQKIDDAPRLTSGQKEFDRVLGGGIVAGSLVLIGGDPGIGKSTLALQIAATIADTLYVSGEESAAQISTRAKRLGLLGRDIKFMAQTDAEAIAAAAEKLRPKLIIVDSIQTLRFDGASGQGMVGQIVAAAGRLLMLAKETGVAIIIIGHVTKEGFVAGPKTLEHLTDAVLYLESDENGHYRILRAVKNRFGSTGEIGVFEMTESGLKEINDPTRAFFGQETDEPIAGSCAALVMEGNRPFLVEIQALVSKTVFGYPQRRATGFDLNRLQMLVAVIGKIAKINLANQDIYLNVAGGLKIKDRAADLAVCLAVVSAFLNLPLDKDAIALGEVGLSGEIRPLARREQLFKEAKRLNFKKIISTGSHEQNDGRVKNLREAIRFIGGEKNIARFANGETGEKTTALT